MTKQYIETAVEKREKTVSISTAKRKAVKMNEAKSLQGLSLVERR